MINVNKHRELMDSYRNQGNTSGLYNLCDGQLSILEQIANAASDKAAEKSARQQTVWSLALQLLAERK